MQTEIPTAFLIHGYLGVGKTTVARQLETERSAIRFTHDEWMSSLYGNDPPEAMFAEYARRVSAVMETTWIRCVELKTNVVLDFGFWSRGERDRVRRLVASLGGKAILFQLACPDEIAWSRIAERNQRPDKNLYIAPNTYRTLRTRFESLAPDEERIAIETGF